MKGDRSTSQVQVGGSTGQDEPWFQPGTFTGIKKGTRKAGFGEEQALVSAKAKSEMHCGLGGRCRVGCETLKFGAGADLGLRAWKSSSRSCDLKPMQQVWVEERRSKSRWRPQGTPTSGGCRAEQRGWKKPKEHEAKGRKPFQGAGHKHRVQG